MRYGTTTVDAQERLPLLQIGMLSFQAEDHGQQLSLRSHHA